MTNKALLKLDGRDAEQTALVCKALASEIRLTILQQLEKGPVGFTELSELLGIPLSTASGHLRLLEQAGLISVTALPGSRGGKKICGAIVGRVEIDLIRRLPDVPFSGCLFRRDMPIGNYFDFEVSAPCGLASPEGFLAPDDDPGGFALPSHVDAQMIWFTTGYLEYHFELRNNGAPPHNIDRVEFSFEACSETYGYNEHWRSDVSVWVNDLFVGTMLCPGDHGGRAGRLNPPWWPKHATQFGDLHHIVLSGAGAAVDGSWTDAPRLQDVLSKGRGRIRLKIGVEKNAQFVGGLNLFGSQFGDHAQGILMQVFGNDPAV
jgi:predicted transcriptional regulator